MAVSDSMAMLELLHHVFDDKRSASPLATASCSSASRKALSLHGLNEHITGCLHEVIAKELKASNNLQAWDCGKLGPADCHFDHCSNVGQVLLEMDKLGVTSHSHFSTIKANSCVYEGKWIYELMLVSKGVMQVGWCSASCKFSPEEGVGDTRESYAYDGGRLRKWNVNTKKYGESWHAGDVISCAIDCDVGAITFYRNGVSLGEAFDQVRVGSGYAYFPAVSLSMGENVYANFGHLPLRYPIEGYKPIQSPKSVEVAQAELLLTYLHNLLPKMVESDQSHAAGSSAVLKSKHPTIYSPPLTDQRTNEVTLYLSASHIFHKLAPLLRLPYVVDMCLLKFMLGLCDHVRWQGEQPYVTKLLDLIWTLLQPPEVKECLDFLAASLLNGYFFHPFHPDFEFSKMYLALTLAVLRHHQTRRHFLNHLLFDRMKLPVLMHMKTPDDENLSHLIPTVWWDINLQRDDDDKVVEAIAVEDPAKDREDKAAFNESCDKLHRVMAEIETMQVEILKSLLVHNDGVDGKTSREIFLEKFKVFLKENTHTHRAANLACSLPVRLCFFHHLCKALRFYWDEFASSDSSFVSSEEAYVPIHCFWNDSRDSNEFLRCGGLMSHLNRQLGAEVNKAQNLDVQEDSKLLRKMAKDADKSTEEYPKLEMPSGNSLLDLLDCTVLFYHISAHKQLGKVSALRESREEYIINLRDTEVKLKKCPEEMEEVLSHLVTAKRAFEDKIREQSRHYAWVLGLIYSPSKQRDLSWLLGVVLKTIDKASAYKKLVQYMPELYLETAVNTYNALRYFFHPSTPFRAIPGLNSLLTRYATFLINHFFDPMLVSNDLKDTLVQSLAGFTCFPHTLRVLEELPMDKRILMIQNLISPYENRSWAHTNWILVRIWKGCGFGYRYRYLPDLAPPKTQPTEFSYVSLQKPCPSQEFQSLLAKILLDDETRSTKFLDTLLTQLNWSFSEFVGIIQEISSSATRSEAPMFLELRLIKICAACFEISVSLLRVLEMVSTVAPQVFTDWSRPSAELFLKRLMQLLSQIMSRITMKDGEFEHTVLLPIQGLDSVTHFPILSVTAGIVAQLIIRCGGSSQEKATRALLLDAGFSTTCLEFALGLAETEEEGQNAAKAEKKDRKLKFSLKKFDEISKEEIEDVEVLLKYLSQQKANLTAEEEAVKEEDLCTICYANPKQVAFVPCSHKSCRMCITQQILTKKECFFCIAPITGLQDNKGRPLLREHFLPSLSKKS